MNVHLPARLATIAVTGAIALAAFAGGAYWNQSVSPVAAEEPAPPTPGQQRGWLGIAISPITDELAAKLGIAKQDGLAVVNVMPDSPAAKAGVQAKDVIKSINGAVVTDTKAAMAALHSAKPGDTVSLGISRNGATQTIAVTASAAPARKGPATGRMAPHLGAGFGMFPNLPELQGIPPAELFDHMVSGAFKLKDKDNKDLTINVLAGKVTSASDTSVTVTPNGGGSSQTFAIAADTKMPGKGSDLKPDAKVVVITKNTSNTAIAIHPMGVRMPRTSGMGGGAGTMTMPFPMMHSGVDWLEGMMPGGDLRMEIERHMQQMPFHFGTQRPEPQT